LLPQPEETDTTKAKGGMDEGGGARGGWGSVANLLVGSAMTRAMSQQVSLSSASSSASA